MLVGRAQEIARIEAALAGGGRLVLLAGEPGIGKSRLVAEVAARRGATVWGRAWEAGGAPSFWPWIQILRALRRDRPEVTAPAEIARLLPELGAPAPATAAAEERFFLFDAVCRYLTAAAPVLVALEDLHAADLASLQLLAFVASHMQGTGVAAIGTYRTTEARTTPELAAAIGKLGRFAETIAPARLGADDIAQLAAAAGVSDRETIAAIARRSEGNPLFARELVELAARGVHTIPESVRAAIREQLGHLPAPARRIAEHAAVIGSEVPVALLGALAGADPAAELVALVERGTLVELSPGRYGFAHGLYAETLHHDLVPAERQRLHARAAALVTSDATRTRHLFEAGRSLEAIAASRRAAAEASQQLAFAEAAALLERALAAAPPDERELICELECERAAIQIHDGEPRAGQASCLRAAELARAIGAPRLLARATHTYGLVITPGATDRTLVALIEESLRALPDGDSPERARLLARLAAALQPTADPQRPIAIGRDAIAIAQRLGDPRTRLDVLFTAVGAFMNFAHPDERRTINREVLALATELGEPTMALRSHYRLMLDHLALGDIAGGRLHQRHYEELARGTRSLPLQAGIAQIRAMFALHAGRLAVYAEETATADRLLREIGAPEAASRLFQLVSLVAMRDDTALANERAAIVATLPSAFKVYELSTVAYLAWRAGDIDTARATLAALPVAELVTFGDMQMFGMLAGVVVACGDRAYATALHAGMTARPLWWASSGAPTLTIEPSMERPLALLAAFLGKREEARRRFATVIDELRTAALPVLLARTLLEYAASGVATADEAARARDEAASLAPDLPFVARVAPARLTLTRDGDTWLVARGAHSCRVKHARGLELIARLVAEPGRELHVLELVDAEGADLGDAGEVLDREAIAAYRKRVLQLREELEDKPSDRKRAELEALEDQLAAGLGTGNRARRTAGAAEKARVNVQRRIADAIRRIGELSPPLGAFLDATIRTGSHCSYDPARAT